MSKTAERVKEASRTQSSTTNSDLLARIVGVLSFLVAAGGLVVAMAAAGFFSNAIKFQVVDTFGTNTCLDIEEVEVVIRKNDGKGDLLADDWITIVNPTIPRDDLAVTVPGPGVYYYSLRGTATLAQDHQKLRGTGNGTFRVTGPASHRFLVISEPNQTYEAGLRCPTNRYPYHLRFNVPAAAK
jgi:hypothetical protein